MPEKNSSTSDVEKNKTIAILSYFLFFLPLLTAKDSKYAMHHANQSLILLIASIASGFIGGLVPFVGGLVSTLISLGVFVLWIMGIMSAAKGEMKPLPIIGTITILK